MIYSNSKEIREQDMEEICQWILSLLKPEQKPTTRALRKGFISEELLTRIAKLLDKNTLTIYVQNVKEKIMSYQTFKSNKKKENFVFCLNFVSAEYQPYVKSNNFYFCRVVSAVKSQL